MAALQWPPEAEGSVLAYKYTQTPHFQPKKKKKKKKKKKILGSWSIFCAFFSLFSIFLFQKHLQTHQNTFNSSLFTKSTR